MMAFLGLANYYRQFIPNYPSRAGPLTDSTKKKSPEKLLWTAEMYQSFDSLKKALISNQVLSSPDSTRPFLLQTDASGIGINAALARVLMRVCTTGGLLFAEAVASRDAVLSYRARMPGCGGQCKALPYLPHWSSVYNSD